MSGKIVNYGLTVFIYKALVCHHWSEEVLGSDFVLGHCGCHLFAGLAVGEGFLRVLSLPSLPSPNHPP